MAVNSVANTSAAASTQTVATTQLNQNFDTFLKLLTTQLQNQDPMAPMDSEKFTNQLVMFSQVEQQIAQNDKLTKLLASSNTQLTQGALGYIGLDVDVKGSVFEFDGKSVELGYQLDEPATSVDVSVFDSTGKLAWAGSATQTDAGTHKVTWDGKDANGNVLDAGKYYIAVTANDASGTPKIATTTVPGRVTGVETTADGVMLTVSGQLISINDVLSAQKPAAAATT
jgi:flagellar basal-body rod modification protein FlgD